MDLPPINKQILIGKIYYQSIWKNRYERRLIELKQLLLNKKTWKYTLGGHYGNMLNHKQQAELHTNCGQWQMIYEEAWMLQNLKITF